MRVICVLSTAPNLSVARKIAHGLLREKLAACINLIPNIESHYVWREKNEKSREVQLIIKTRANCFKKIEAFFEKNHPYDVPELIVLPVQKGSASYLKWVIDSVRD